MSNETKVLSIRINCCDKCRNGVPYKIRKMSGVDNVAIDDQENLVYVFGEIDGETLLNNVAKLGKKVKLLSAADKQPMSQADENQTKSEPRGEKGKQHINCCCGDGRHHSRQKRAQEKEERKKAKEKEKEEHKCEDYVPPAISADVCKDFFCKVHPRGRVITDRVPAEITGSFFGMPYYGREGPYQYPMGSEGWYGPQQPPPQPGYGGQQAPPRRNPHNRQFVFQ